jgi:hypothetical protein
VSDSHLDWWMDAQSQWHQGEPPPDWWQASDGRWHAPTWEDATEEASGAAPPGGRHLAGGGRWQHVVDAYWGWPRWARIATPVAAMFVVIAAIGLVAALGLRDGDDGRIATDESTTTPPESTAPSSDLAAAGPAGTTTTVSATTSTASTTTPQESEPTATTIAPPTPSTPPPTAPPEPDRGVQPRAPCSPEGATAVSDEGVPLICTIQKCRGAPYDQPRWREATC